MSFTPSADTLARLQAFTMPDTWWTTNSADDGRFYDFVLHCWIDHPSIWDEKAVRERLLQVATESHPGIDMGEAAAAVEDRLHEGSTILQFLAHVKESKEVQFVTRKIDPGEIAPRPITSPTD